MKSILETLALGATLAALATMADAASTSTPPANPPVHVASAADCPQHTQSASPSGATKGWSDVKADCAAAANAAPSKGTSGNATPPSH